MLENVSRDKHLYLAISLYSLVAFMLSRSGDYFGTVAAYAVAIGVPALVVLPIIALTVDFSIVICRLDRRRRLGFRLVYSRKRLASMAATSLLFMALSVFMGSFTTLKTWMFSLHGRFPYDVTQADIDAALHGGADPWTLLTPLLENDAAMAFVSWNYSHLFFLLVFIAVFQIARDPRPSTERTRALWTFLLVWIVVGNIFAATFLSAGPVYYGAVTGDQARFSGLLALLNSGPGAESGAAVYHDYLWSLHLSGKTTFASGISAFPSVHVGLAAFLAVVAWERGRVLGAVAAVYAAVIAVSSVALAWHYAIDGYAALAIVLVIHLMLKTAAWRLSGLRLVRRQAAFSAR